MQLDEKLNANGHPARVVNFGVTGYTTYQNLVEARRACPAQTPKIVILCNGHNDSEVPSFVTDREAGRRNRLWSTELLHELNHSRLFCAYRTLLQWLRGDFVPTNPGPAPIPENARVPLPDYRDNILGFYALARQYNFTLLLVSEPMPFRETEKRLARYYDVMRDIAANHPGVFFVDVRPRFWDYRRAHRIPYLDEVRGDFDVLFADICCHPTDFGHSLYADAIYEALVANHLVK